MGSARVQYELERTLPSLQLAAQHGIFDKDKELRAITEKRRRFENSLVRRHAMIQDFERYVDYEQDLFSLLQMRIKRLSNEEEIPRADVHSMINHAKSHIISIFERGVKRLRHEVDLWIRYMRWGMQQKMRSAVSRISARALALFPGNISLWLMVSNYELNQNLNVITARALLLRALRLNHIPHAYSISAAVEQRPSKRAKNNDGASSTREQIRPTGKAEEDTPTFVTPEKVKQIMHLWLEYIRMELVFLERIRRRQAVLNIGEDGDAGSGQNQDEAEDLHEAEDRVSEGEQEVSSTLDGQDSPVSVAQITREESGKQVAPDESGDSIVLGAIPITAIKSAVSLDSSISLPPNAHFFFLMAVVTLFATFPFYGNAEKLTNRLFHAIGQALQERYRSNAVALVLRTTLPLIESARHDAEQHVSEATRQDELENAHRLRSSSQLKTSIPSELLKDLSHEGGESQFTTNQPEKPLNVVIVHATQALKSVSQASSRASLIRKNIEALRNAVRIVDHPKEAHILAQAHVVKAYQAFAKETQMGLEFDAFLNAILKQVWKDARRLQVDVEGKDEPKTIQAFEQISETGDAANVLRQAVRTYHSVNHNGKLYLDISMTGMIEALQSGKMEAKASEQAWRFALSNWTEEDVVVWNVWYEFLRTIATTKDRIRLLKKAFEAQLVPYNDDSTIVHSLIAELLDVYGIKSTTTFDDEFIRRSSELVSYSGKVGLAGVRLLREIVFVVRLHIEEAMATGDQAPLTADKDLRLLSDFLIRTFERLVRQTDSLDDYAALLYAECCTLRRPNDAIRRFRALSDSLARTSPEANQALERRWQAILKTLRQSDKENEDDEQDE